MRKHLSLLGLLGLAMVLAPGAAFAQESAAGGSLGLLSVGVGLTMGVAALGGTLGQGKAIGMALDAIGRNPGAAGKIFTPMIIGLVFVESLVILSFVIAIQLLGKA